MKFLIEAISKFTTKKYNNKWSYDRQDEWYAYNSCSCMLSPFNIKPNFFVSGMPKLNIINKQININIVNYDYTMQCHATGENILLVDDKQYNLVRFHFHYPSEYAINGQKFVMELHFVYQDAEENLLVLGVMELKNKKR